MVLTHYLRGIRRDGSEGKVVCQPVEVGLLRFVHEVAGVQYWVIGLHKEIEDVNSSVT